MKTITDEIKQVITGSAFLEEGIGRGIVNLSALAREILPYLRTQLYKDISLGAVIMALKRQAEKMAKKGPLKARKVVLIGDLIVRSSLTEFTFRISDTTVDRQRALMKETKRERSQFVTFTRGIDEVTIIISSMFNASVEKIFKDEQLIQRMDGLASITCKLYEQVIKTPGTYYTILKLLAWENINVIEVVSTYTEFTIVLSRDEVDHSFSILMKYLHPKK